jgi:hypothetical protein
MQVGGAILPDLRFYLLTAWLAIMFSLPGILVFYLVSLLIVRMNKNTETKKRVLALIALVFIVLTIFVFDFYFTSSSIEVGPVVQIFAAFGIPFIIGILLMKGRHIEKRKGKRGTPLPTTKIPPNP